MKYSPWNAITVVQARERTAGLRAVAGETEGWEIYLQSEIDRM